MPILVIKNLGYVWFLKNTEERKKNVKENNYHTWSSYIKYQEKKNQISFKLAKNFCILKFGKSPCIETSF